MMTLALCGGILIGIAFSLITRTIANLKYVSWGVLKVDRRRNICKVCLDSQDIVKKKTKRVILRIEHNANLPQN